MQYFTGKQYLKIDIANHFGLDKLNWDERLAWFDDNADRLESLLPEAEDPAQYHAGVNAYRKVEKGLPTGYTISLDATASGLQLLACLTGDRKAAELCNVVDTGQREDAYTGLYDAMKTSLDKAASIERKDAKQALMTSLYGSTAQPKNIFGEGPVLELFYQTVASIMPGAWTLNSTMLELWNPDALAYEWVLPDNFHVKTKVTATVREAVIFEGMGHEVSYDVQMAKDKGKSLGANMVHSIDGMVVRELSRRCHYDAAQVTNLLRLVGNGWNTRSSHRPKDKTVMAIVSHYKETGFLSARVIDLLDEDNIGLVDPVALSDLLTSLPAMPFELIAVHDAFRCLPNYGNDLRLQYNRILSQIAKSNLLSYLIIQIAGENGWNHLLGNFHPIANDLDENLWKDILKADYALS